MWPTGCGPSRPNPPWGARAGTLSARGRVGREMTVGTASNCSGSCTWHSGGLRTPCAAETATQHRRRPGRASGGERGSAPGGPSVTYGPPEGADQIAFWVGGTGASPRDAAATDVRLTSSRRRNRAGNASAEAPAGRGWCASAPPREVPAERLDVAAHVEADRFPGEWARSLAAPSGSSPLVFVAGCGRVRPKRSGRSGQGRSGTALEPRRKAHPRRTHPPRRKRRERRANPIHVPGVPDRDGRGGPTTSTGASSGHDRGWGGSM